MKIRILDENEQENNFKKYTTIEVPDDDYSITIDLDYETRLREAPEKEKHKVKRCESLQEVMDIYNDREFNNWRKFRRHTSDSKASLCAKDEDFTGELELFVNEVFDERVFFESDDKRDEKSDEEEICEWIRQVLSNKPHWAEAFIMVKFFNVPLKEYAKSIGESDSTVCHWISRAKKKLKEFYPNRQF